MALNKLVDMELSDDDKLDKLPTLAPALKDQPDYPYGLRICLDECCISKLEEAGVIDGEPERGEYIMLNCLARVTEVSKTDGEMGKRRRVELQIEKMGPAGGAGD